MLVLIRRAVAARIVLLSCGIFVFALTMIYGLFKPIFSMNAWSGIPFTLVAGLFITAGLILIARFASAKVATFFVSFLAVQCVLNALFDLKTVFFLWTVVWIAFALGILWFAMRMYVAGRDKSYQPDLPFEDTPGSV